MLLLQSSILSSAPQHLPPVFTTPLALPKGKIQHKLLTHLRKGLVDTFFMCNYLDVFCLCAFVFLFMHIVYEEVFMFNGYYRLGFYLILILKKSVYQLIMNRTSCIFSRSE